MQFKQTKKLFYGKYQYKIVLVFSGAHLFRNAPGDVIADRIKNVKLETDVYARKRWTIKTEEELQYAIKLEHVLSTLDNIEIRVETPWVTVYTNNKRGYIYCWIGENKSLLAISRSHNKRLSCHKTFIYCKINRVYAVICFCN